LKFLVWRHDSLYENEIRGSIRDSNKETIDAQVHLTRSESRRAVVNQPCTLSFGDGFMLQAFACQQIIFTLSHGKDSEYSRIVGSLINASITTLTRFTRATD